MEVAKLSGVEKAALLLLCLGEQATAKVFEELNDTEVRLISRCMMNIEHVPSEAAKEILKSYEKSQDEFAGIFVEGGEFVKKAIAAGIMDRKRAEMLMDQLNTGTDNRPLETIAMMQPRMVAGLLENEHPQTVALILSTQRPDHAARILDFLPEQFKAEVMYRIAKIDRVSPEVISQIETALQKEIGVVAGKEQRQVGGVDKVVEILGRMEKGSDRSLLSLIEETDKEMAEEIQRKIFTFQDMVELDDKALQTVLRQVSNDQLTLALKTASQSLRDRIFSNISSRAAEMIEEDLEAMGPVRLSEVEKVQQSIVMIALKLEEEGEIAIPGRGGQDELV